MSSGDDEAPGSDSWQIFGGIERIGWIHVGLLRVASAEAGGLENPGEVLAGGLGIGKHMRKPFF